MEERYSFLTTVHHVYSSQRRPVHDFMSYATNEGIQLQFVKKGNKHSQTFEAIKKGIPCFGKKVPMVPEDFECLHHKHHISLKHLMEGDTYTIWREIFIMQLLNQLLSSRISPHAPSFLGYHFSFDAENEENTEQPHLFLLQEAFDTDLKSWATSRSHPTEDWFACFFQIFFGIFALQKFVGISHNDLHWGNILVKKLSKPDSWTYQMDDNMYCTMTHQKYLFAICDYGFSRFDPHITQGSTHSLKDIKRLVLNIFKWMGRVPEPSLQRFLDSLQKTEATTMKQVFHEVIQPYFKNKSTPAYTVFDMSTISTFSFSY